MGPTNGVGLLEKRELNNGQSGYSTYHLLQLQRDYHTLQPQCIYGFNMAAGINKTILSQEVQ
jgi:hypothetical protein